MNKDYLQDALQTFNVINGYDGWKTTIQAIKDKYPKE